MDIKVEIKEECFEDLNSENERGNKDPVKKDKIETTDSDINPELEEDSTCCSQNEEHNLMVFNEAVEGSEIETKIYIKEEHCWLKREDLCDPDDIKDGTQEDFYATKNPSEYKEGVSIYTSDSFCIEDIANDISFNMKDGPECEHHREYQSQKGLVTNIPSTETSICSETSNNGKIVSMAASSKLRELLEQSKSNKQDTNKNCQSILNDDYRKSYKWYVSEKLPDLKRPKLINEGLKPHKYNICNTAFTESSNFKKSKIIHKGIKSHQCNICNKTFTQLSSLKIHRLIHEGIRPHKCNICNKDFTKLSDLKRHKLVHQDIKSHKCNICDKAFATLTYLKKHKLIHEGIKEHKCNICNKAFTHLPNLIRHKLIHEGIKPYNCKICNKAFAQSSHLKTHKLIHDGIKPHKCDICCKPFSDLSTLKQHKLIHEGLKPHMCNFCNKAFTQSAHLKRHKLTHKTEQVWNL